MRDIIIEHKIQGLQRINDFHPSFMSIQYPILFPYGEDSFHLGITYKNFTGQKRIKIGSMTALEYHAFVIQQCLYQGLTLLKGGKLFHQYVVNAFTSIEGMRLEYIRNNQKNLRTDVL